MEQSRARLALHGSEPELHLIREGDDRLPQVLEGDLDELIEALTAAEQGASAIDATASQDA